RLKPPRDFERRLAPLRLPRGLRSGGGSSSISSSSSTSTGLRLAADFFGWLSPPGIRSSGDRRKSPSAAASPNSGSLRPPLFFRPHAIRNNAHTGESRSGARYR